MYQAPKSSTYASPSDWHRDRRKALKYLTQVSPDSEEANKLLALIRYLNEEIAKYEVNDLFSQYSMW